MAGPAEDSDRIIDAAQASLVRQRSVERSGEGRRRVQPIGQASARMRARHRTRKLGRIAVAVLAILFAAVAAGLVLGGIGFEGLFVTALALAAAVFVLARYPRLGTPDLAELNRGDVRQLVGRTELWLEAQRPALPAPAVGMVNRIGVQLDALGAQLEGIEPAHPAAQEVRSLVGEHLPAMIESYRRIPAELRGEDRAGGTPDQHLTDGLGKISAELDQVTRQIAAGDLDSLAVRGRYLDYRYGGEFNEGSTR